MLLGLGVSVPIVAKKGCEKGLKTLKENLITSRHRSQPSQRRTQEMHIWGGP